MKTTFLLKLEIIKILNHSWFICPTTHIVYFDQLSGAAHIGKLVEILFFSCFQPFLFLLKIFSVFKIVNLSFLCFKRHILTSFWSVQHQNVG